MTHFYTCFYTLRLRDDRFAEINYTFVFSALITREIVAMETDDIALDLITEDQMEMNNDKLLFYLTFFESSEKIDVKTLPFLGYLTYRNEH